MSDFKPGDSVKLVDPDLHTVRTVIALPAPGLVLCHDGRLIAASYLVRVDGETDTVRVDPDVYKHLLGYKLVGPDIKSLVVGDGVLLIDGVNIRFTVVAVIDRPRGTVYTKDGEILSMKNANVARSNWHTDEKDLLSEQGREELHNLYY